MSYKQYTQCVQPVNHQASPIPQAVGYALFATMMNLVVTAMATGGLSLLAGGITALLAIVAGLISFAHWWLYGRLVCLDGERCAIGMVVSVEPPWEKSGFERMDSDYSFNLLLPPHTIGSDYATISADGLLGELIKEQGATKNVGLGFVGYQSRSCDTDPKTEVLHCEFEGAGMYIFYQWLKVLLGLLTAAAVASWLCYVPVIGWIACAIATGLAIVALIGIFTSIGHAMNDAASPSDVNPDLGGSLSTNGCTGRGADLLVVSGEWIYDSLHDGWNEIHPVRHAQKISNTGWEGTWPFDARRARDRWCDAIDDSRDPVTRGNQKKPENRWQLHPLIDGCAPEIEQPPID